MIKLKATVLASCAILISNAYAGDIGPATINTPLINTAFVGIEGAYTWNHVSGIHINEFSAEPQLKNWGGRASIGTQRTIANNISLSAEAGWGYYDEMSLKIPLIGKSNTTDVYGFDLLFGATRSYQNFEFYAKAGAMAELLRVKDISDLSAAYPGDFYSGIDQVSSTYTFIVPEIKFGGIYNVTEQLGISLAYMYVFGWNTGITATQAASTTGIISTQNLRSGPPAFNTVMLGLRYNIG